MPLGIQLKQFKYINNILEQEHRFIKKRVCSMLGLKSCSKGTSVIRGTEPMHTIKKGQLILQSKFVQN